MVKRNPLTMDLKEKIKPEDRLMDNMVYKLTYCFHAVCENATNLTLKQMDNDFWWISGEKDKWLDGEISTQEIVRIAKEDRPYIAEAINAVPYSTLLKLAGIKPGKGKSTKWIYMNRYLRYSMAIIYVSVDNVFKDHRRYSLEDRKMFFRHMAAAADLMGKGAITEEAINGQFRDRLHYDLKKGEKVG